jgi:hypothetical protein
MAKDSGRIKSAYELAMERLGGTEEAALTQEQKARLTEIRRLYESKIAEKKIVLEREAAEAMQRGEFEEAEKLRERLIAEVAELNQKMEEERDKVRRRKRAK